MGSGRYLEFNDKKTGFKCQTSVYKSLKASLSPECGFMYSEIGVRMMGENVRCDIAEMRLPL